MRVQNLATVLDGAKSMAMTALDFMTDAELRQKTKDSFAETGDASKKSVESAWRENGITHLAGAGAVKIILNFASPE